MSLAAAEAGHQFLIRPFMAEDFEQVLKMAIWLSKSSSFSNAGLDMEKVASLFANIGTSDDQYFCRLAVSEDGTIAGIFIGVLEEYYFSSALMGRDMAVMFRPDMRQGHIPAMVEMFSAFEDWAKSKGALEVNMGAATGIDGKGLSSTLQVCGYKQRGYYMRKRLD